MKKIIITLSVVIALSLFIVSPGFSDYEPEWKPIVGSQYNMVVFGELYMNDQKADSSNYVLAAFGPGGESDCRAITWMGEVNTGFYMTIRGNRSGESIEFKVFDTDTGDKYDAGETLTFYPDATNADFALNIAQEEMPEPELDDGEEIDEEDETASDDEGEDQESESDDIVEQDEEADDENEVGSDEDLESDEGEDKEDGKSDNEDDSEDVVEVIPVPDDEADDSEDAEDSEDGKKDKETS